MQNHKLKGKSLHNTSRSSLCKIHLKKIYLHSDMQMLNYFQIDRAWSLAMISQAVSPQSWALCDITNDTQAISLYIGDIKKQIGRQMLFSCPIDPKLTEGSFKYDTQLNFLSECTRTMTKAKPNRWPIDCQI